MKEFAGSERGKDCFVRGLGITVTGVPSFVSPPFWRAAVSIGFTSGDYY